MKSKTYDLSFVAPHRRSEILRRIAIIEVYLDDPTRLTAERCAREMGVNIVHLYNLARIWRESRRPEALPGAGRPRKRRQHIAPRLERLVAQAVRDKPDEKLEHIVEHLRVLAGSHGVTLPGSATLRKYVGEALTGHLPATSYAANSDWVVDHCVVDVPVSVGTVGSAMPLATILLETVTAKVLGVVLSEDGPRAASVARVLLRAISNDKKLGTGRRVRIALETLPGPEWPLLATLLVEAGFELEVRKRKSVGNAETAPRLLGQWKNGIRLYPRGARRPFAQRPQPARDKRSALSLQDAEELIQNHWEEEAGIDDPYSFHKLSPELESRLALIASEAAN